VAGGSSGLSEWAVTGLGPGSLIAGYRVEARIGAGGMAMVLRARDVKLGRTVALKIVAPALAENREFRERFERESRAVAAVDHPHIIPVYAAGEANGVLYLAMRFIPGGDLRSLVQREGPLPGDRAIALLGPIAAALDAAHRTGLLHRDVKPANILIDSSPDRPEHPYLSDFGLAKGGTSATGLTGTGQFVGTPDYAAPEQIAGKPARPQTDQYALACVAYATLTGTHPFAKDESMAVLWAHMYDPPPSLAVRRPDLPAAADPVLARALAKAPEDRYATCGEFTDALRAALSVPARAGLGARFGSSGPPTTETADWPWRADRSAQAAAAHAPTMAPGLAVAPGPGPSVSPGLPAESPLVPPVGTVTGALLPGRSRPRRDHEAGGGDGGRGRRRWPMITALIVGATVLVDGGLAAWLYSHGQAANAANPASPPTVTRMVTVDTKPKVIHTVITTGPNGAPETVVTTVQGPAPTRTVTATKTFTLVNTGPSPQTVTVTATPTATPTVTVTTTVTITATPTVTG
jgi:tRNA A-37 threonylcarbamoyl transferase component Bud32